MRDIIKKQLDACRYADFSDFDAENNIYKIKKYTKPIYELNKSYIIKVAKQLLLDKNSVLAVNWNNGSLPKDEYLSIFVVRIVGNMLLVDSQSYDINTKQTTGNLWTGFLPVTDIEQLEVI